VLAPEHLPGSSAAVVAYPMAVQLMMISDHLYSYRRTPHDVQLGFHHSFKLFNCAV
jgi:hypothetical protein